MVFLWAVLLPGLTKSQVSVWKSGVAKTVITPEKPLWMAGYAARDRPADGSLHPLWAKALVVEDSRGSRAVFVSSDLLGLPKNISDNIARRLQNKFNLERSQIMLTSSHTHSGPVLDNSLADIYPMDGLQKQEVENYSRWLEDKVVDVVTEALLDLESSKIYAGNGNVRFAVNRRNNPEDGVTELAELKGPIDHSVPVLKITNKDGSLKAVVFGYACHATTLNGYQWSGDYPGFAQSALESQYTGITAMFFAGCGADQNPLPRRSIPLAKQYGMELSAAVSRTLEESMRELHPTLGTKYNELELPYIGLPKINELQPLAASDIRYQRKWAERWLSAMESGTPVPATYPFYPIQTWKLGGLMWVALGGEVVVGYSNKIKALLGQDIFVSSYANDVMAYIPTLKVLNEGGYEGATSMQVYGLPATWSPKIEEQIINEVNSQVLSLQLETQEK